MVEGVEPALAAPSGVEKQMGQYDRACRPGDQLAARKHEREHRDHQREDEAVRVGSAGEVLKLSWGNSACFDHVVEVEREAADERQRRA